MKRINIIIINIINIISKSANLSNTIIVIDLLTGNEQKTISLTQFMI